MSSNYFCKPGLNHAASYQVSGIPWLTSSIVPSSGEVLSFSFPRVTKFITVKNTNSSPSTLRFGFDRDRLEYSTGDYCLLSSGESLTVEVRVADFHIMSDDSTNISFSLAAGLTAIERREYPEGLTITPISLLAENNFQLITENENYIVLE